MGQSSTYLTARTHDAYGSFRRLLFQDFARNLQDLGRQWYSHVQGLEEGESRPGDLRPGTVDVLRMQLLEATKM